MKTITHEFAGADWLRASYKLTPSPLGTVVADLLGFVYRGLYHIESSIRNVDWSDNDYITVQLPRGADIGSYDFSEMTTLVLLAHDLHVRVAVCGRGINMMRLSFSPRSREGGICSRHPDLETHIAGIRSRYKVVELSEASS